MNHPASAATSEEDGHRVAPAPQLLPEGWDCAGTRHDVNCDPLRIPRATTYGDALRKISREHLGQEGSSLSNRGTGMSPRSAVS